MRAVITAKDIIGEKQLKVVKVTIGGKEIDFDEYVERGFRVRQIAREFENAGYDVEIFYK